MVYDLSDMLLDLVCHYFIEEFCINFIEEIAVSTLSVIFFFYYKKISEASMIVKIIVSVHHMYQPDKNL
jgi:hypothetical protein